jgi:putative Holliday junction resolvase
MRYLGIDYGSKRIGLSISDEEGIMAFPYKVVLNNLELVDSIHNICGVENIGAIVLGESKDVSGKSNKIMGSIEEFKRNIEAELELPVYFEQEFMTSMHSSEQKFKDIFIAKKIKKEKLEKDDSKAATLILQRFLEKKNKAA